MKLHDTLSPLPRPVHAVAYQACFKQRFASVSTGLELMDNPPQRNPHTASDADCVRKRSAPQHGLAGPSSYIDKILIHTIIYLNGYSTTTAPV